MILGLITLEHNLSLSILSFETVNYDLYYVPEKFILIECGYLGSVCFTENDFQKNIFRKMTYGKIFYGKKEREKRNKNL